jgi:non-homologous end joining protein Ku
MCLRLLKAGQVVASQRVKQHFMQAAKEIQLLSDQQRLDPKRLEMLNTNINNMVKYTKAAGAQGNKVEDGDYVRYFARIEKRFNKMKKAHEEELEKVIEDFTQFKAEDYSH